MSSYHQTLLAILFGLFSCQLNHAQLPNVLQKTVLNKRLKESSGLVFTKQGLWTLNDGLSNSIFRIDTTTGEILQEIKVANFRFVDAESLATDGQFIYVGDAGNNDGNRKDLKIIRVAIDSIGTQKEQLINGEGIYFTYPDQLKFDEEKKQNAFDCEAMVCMGDALLLFTKRRNDNTTHCYNLPTTAGTYTATPKENYNVQGLITDAALSFNKQDLALLGYEKGHYNSFMYVFKDFATKGFSGKMKRILLGTTEKEWQSEGIVFASNNSLLLSCETTKDYPASLFILK